MKFKTEPLPKEITIGNKLSIQLYDERFHLNDLEKFCAIARNENLINNDSIKKMTSKKNAGLFLVFYEDEIASVTMTHDFSDYFGENAWRVWSRTATLGKFRGKMFPRRKTIVSAAGLTVFSLPMQIEYAKSFGGKKFLFTTNSNMKDGFDGSVKLNKYLHKIVNHDITFDYVCEKEIYGVKQSVWKVNYSDVLSPSEENRLD